MKKVRIHVSLPEDVVVGLKERKKATGRSISAQIESTIERASKQRLALELYSFYYGLGFIGYSDPVFIVDRLSDAFTQEQLEEQYNQLLKIQGSIWTISNDGSYSFHEVDLFRGLRFLSSVRSLPHNGQEYHLLYKDEDQWFPIVYRREPALI